MLLITALQPFCTSPFGERGLEGQMGLVVPLWRLAGVQGKGGDGSEAVTEGPAGRAQECGEGRPLTPGLGAHPPTTSPPLSAESLCLRKWLSGQCPGPADRRQSSGLGHPPGRTLMVPLTAPSALRASRGTGVHLAPYLIGVIFLHPGLAVILAGEGWREDC